MKKVFITNFCGFDYTVAQSFGELVALTSGKINKGVNPQTIVKQCGEKIKNASPDDYILLSGSQIVTVLIVIQWLKIHGVARLLSFSQSKGIYEECTVTNAQELWEEQSGQSS